MNFTTPDLISALLAAVAVAVVAWLLHRQKQATLTERLRLREEEAIQAGQELTVTRKSAEMRSGVVKFT